MGRCGGYHRVPSKDNVRATFRKAGACQTSLQLFGRYVKEEDRLLVVPTSLSCRQNVDVSRQVSPLLSSVPLLSKY